MCLIYNKSETFSCIIINVREASFSLEKQATRKNTLIMDVMKKTLYCKIF